MDRKTSFLIENDIPNDLFSNTVGQNVLNLQVSIGRRDQNGKIAWFCLGSLITEEFILTAAICLERYVTLLFSS